MTSPDAGPPRAVDHRAARAHAHEQGREQQQRGEQAQQEDPIQKLKKYADLKQQGIISEEEFQKLKADLLSKI